jgi:hypothetical protein
VTSAWDDVAVRSVVSRLGAGVAAVGLITTVIGTFLPWLRSGSVLRDSYQAREALRGLIRIGNALFSALFTVWPAVIPACAACVALYALRLPRIAAIACGVTCAAAGATAAFFVGRTGSQSTLIDVVTTGPVVTMTGAAVGFVGAIVAALGPARQRFATPVGGRQ